ncbi:YraN family protein [Chitinibacter sp. GC72]|uniref:YraN family protein n=1 Tax=Chitinibacter sp. GC72 TaxID=1526917 RepID=UPI0012F8F099|nr:YraN family protein [Chitinibacter sp. GC72]
MNDKGQLAEQMAAAYLIEHGLTILARNWSCRHGEIDLVAQDGKQLVFVEVRMRQSSRFGGAAASITPAKQAKLWASAQQYLQGIKSPPACRFDAICIDGQTISWLKNCISA